ncbi:hypothetical protein A8C56_18950 [Niabella ginsenosidivorans]|uniref:Uncharacterized protein n=1 Tax=Niabella ginsenosidivorans TaxID=1176587 RepID=A0A1A9I7V0_9BACT|nr:hypothetical protein [Niabella ginsenosidivorans]ANH82780.1 hypothetical protein A8C56_18950 [Niabella ginsenosidivorans]
MKAAILGINISNHITDHLKKHSDWSIVPAATVEEAIEKMQQIDFEVVTAPDAWLEEKEEAKLKKLLSIQQHDSMWITYTDETANSLEKEIETFITDKAAAPRSSFSVIDDGFKSPEITIEIL